MSRARTVLVTGAAGFVGLPTTRLLAERGFDVVAVDNFSTGSRERFDVLAATSSVRIAEVDIRDAESLRRVVGDAEPWGVIHLAAVHFIPYCRAHPAETIAINVVGTQNLLDALGSVDAKRFVFASTVDVYQPSSVAHHESSPVSSTNVYGASKVMGETLVELWRREREATTTVVARLTNVFGPGETNPHVLPDICAHMRVGDRLPLGNVQPRRDYIFVDDVADGLSSLLAGDPTDATVNLATGVSYSVEELVSALRTLTGRNLLIDVDPGKVRPSDRPVLDVDVSTLHSLLPDFRPRSLDVGLERLLVAESLMPNKIPKP